VYLSIAWPEPTQTRNVLLTPLTACLAHLATCAPQLDSLLLRSSVHLDHNARLLDRLVALPSAIPQVNTALLDHTKNWCALLDSTTVLLEVPGANLAQPASSAWEEVQQHAPRDTTAPEQKLQKYIF
jgi:hypothetical protein